MKVKITARRIILLLSVLAFAGLLAVILPKIPWPIYSVNYHGITMSFRVNLREARSVPVYPSEELVYRSLMNSLVENVTIVFKPGSDEENTYYAVEVFEITNKLAIAFQRQFGYMPSFNVKNVTSYDNLAGKIQNPIIALVHPVYSNETSVRLDGHVIFISGNNSSSAKEQLKNFDLAVVKFLMIELGIEEIVKF
jgi:hypothetical protein